MRSLLLILPLLPPLKSSLLRLTPVLVDVDPKTFNIDPKAIEAAITPKTKAIIPVHLFGQTADMETINAIARKHNLFVVEDNAQGIGATYTYEDGSKAKTGTLGHVAATSFFPSKNLGLMAMEEQYLQTMMTWPILFVELLITACINGITTM